jgi:predicted Holliday junction resolvase-like endonuclease
MKSLNFTRNIFSILVLVFTFLIVGSVEGQTNPTAVNLPYSQSFGNTTFISMPNDMIAWNGLSGGAINSLQLAESSIPSGNSIVSVATVAQTDVSPDL